MRSPSLGAFVLAAVFSGGCNPPNVDPNGNPIKPSTAVGVQSVTLTPPAATIPVGSTIQLAVSVVADASTLRTVSWTSSAASVASVDQNGKVTGVAPGTATIIATSTVDASKAAAAVISVQGPPIVINSINGTYIGSGPAEINSCSFNAIAPASGVLNVDASGVGTWILTHTAVNVVFSEAIKAALTGSATGATFTGSTTQTVGVDSFLVTDSATVSGKNITDTQTLTRLGNSPCTVRYNFSLTKQ